MKKLSKAKCEIINGLSCILSYLSPDIINEQIFDKLKVLDSHDYQKIINIAYKQDFDNLNEPTKNSFKHTINSVLNADLTDDEIALVFDGDIYFPFDNAENPKIIKGLLRALKLHYQW